MCMAPINICFGCKHSKLIDNTEMIFACNKELIDNWTDSAWMDYVDCDEWEEFYQFAIDEELEISINKVFAKHDIAINDIANLLEDSNKNLEVVKAVGIDGGPDYLLMAIGKLIEAYQRWQKE